LKNEFILWAYGATYSISEVNMMTINLTNKKLTRGSQLQKIFCYKRSGEKELSIYL